MVARADDYVDCLEDYVSTARTKGARRGLIISGAFPDECTPKDQQDIIDAVHAFASRVFERGGMVIFGTHPTFVPLIFAMARKKRPNDFQQAVRLHISQHFAKVTTGYEADATVLVSPDLGDRNASLTEMRKRMTHDENAAGLVAIGGRRPRAGIPPGVDEEVEQARLAGVPAFLIGSVQGRSAELAAGFASREWKDAPNGLSAEENYRLQTSLDYAGLASMVLRTLGI